jgi:tRNA U55 pseudouridine synthase TruB
MMNDGKANEIKLKLRVDTTNNFILDAMINIDTPKNITSKQVSAILLQYLTDEKVI